MTTAVLLEALRYAYALALLSAAQRVAVIAVLALLPVAAWTAWRIGHRRSANRSAGGPGARLRTRRALG